jgi:hypothetical protein
MHGIYACIAGTTRVSITRGLTCIDLIVMFSGQCITNKRADLSLRSAETDRYPVCIFKSVDVNSDITYMYARPRRERHGYR